LPDDAVAEALWGVMGLLDESLNDADLMRDAAMKGGAK
jgi:hypothetical protein